MKLKLGIQRVGRIVFGRVLEQDESLLCPVFKEVVRGPGSVVKSIRSYLHPALSLKCDESEDTLNAKCLYIRGSETERDNDWFAYRYPDCKTAIQAVKDIKMLVAKVNTDEQEEPDNCGLEAIE